MSPLYDHSMLINSANTSTKILGKLHVLLSISNVKIFPVFDLKRVLVKRGSKSHLNFSQCLC